MSLSRVTKSLALTCAVALLGVSAAEAASSDGGRYSTRVANSGAGGDPGYFYVGGPLNVTLKDSQGGSARYELCVTPAPIDRPSCAHPRVNRAYSSLSPSKATKTKLRFKLADGRIIIRYIHVRKAQGR